MSLKLFFWPFSLIYFFVLKIRHFLFDYGILRSDKASVKTICIGNLTMGGSGKTPMINYLSSILKKNYSIAILSRGYGRRSSAFKEVLRTDLVSEVGDEPLLLKRNQSDVHIYVDHDRLKGVRQIQKVLNHIDIILLDDAMQHRSLNSDINVLLTDYQCVFSEDYLFPVGKLRDLRERASIADIILVTKSPSSVDSEARNIKRYSISKYSQAPVFFSSIIYENPLLFFKNSPCTFPESAILVTGIANHSHIENYVRSKCTILNSYHYRDHYSFGEKEVSLWITSLHHSNSKTIITTEKDAVRLIEFEPMLKSNLIELIIVPIQIYIEEEVLFLSTLESLMINS